MASTEKVSRNKNQNIQVFVRLRPLNQRERGIRSLSVVDVINSKEVVVRQSQQTSHTKKFTFDRAFAPNASQVEVYKEVVSPLIAEVLAGYNCTVFAYGQTGTGKTHTMVGESTTEGTTWQNDPLAGIIPRALSQLFDELRISNTEYTVRVSYLELYNEELCDLLAPDEAAKLRIYEDVTRKGSTIVNGLEEITVYNKNEVYNIMAQGQERKRVASTLMNTQSSRSHTVFTIVVHIKENCPKGEELVKIGKLNLVDLAGSENISKAGSDNPAKKERARECVNINQSLLTLGRVITALVEKHPHIPYRESKLTRILQESLGGRTKTSIIATVSPGHKDLEETMSTLEYAHRAKNIQNKPEVNQKLTKQAILKEYAEEVDKLKRELLAARDKHGVYLPSDMYDEMQIKDDEQRREIQALLLKQRAMEDERARLEAVFAEMEQRRARTERDLHAERGELAHTRSVLSATEQQRAEQEHLVSQLAQTEAQLAQQARQLVDTADVATEHVQCLHDCVDRRQTVECTNHEMVSSYREQATAQREQIIGHANECTDTFMAVREQMQANIDEHAKEGSATHDLNIQDIAQLVAKIASFVNEAKAKSAETEKQLSETSENHAAATECAMRARHETLSGALAQFLATVSAGVQRVEDAALADTVARAAQQWVSEACGRVRCLQTSHSAHASGARALEGRRDAAARQHHAARQARLRARDAALHACLEELEKNNHSLEASLAQQQASMEADRVSTCERLQRLEDTSRALEQQLRQAAADAAEQRAAYDARMTQYHKALQEKRQLLAESMERCLRLRQQLAEASGEESETESARLERCASESAECLRGVQEFEKEFGEGTHAISAEMEAFGHSVVQIVGATSDQLLAGLRDATHTAQQGVETTLSRDLLASEAAAAATRAALSGTVGTATTCLNSVLHAAVEKSESTIETLSAVSERNVRLAGSLLEHQSGQSGSLEQAAECVERLGGGLRERLGRQAEAEGRYLMQEYRVYEPSGHTPARREFRYPRRLAATSPHERILARFRAQHPRHEDTERANTRSPDSDCVVLESDEGRNTSDSDVSESSVSEDSAVAMQ